MIVIVGAGFAGLGMAIKLKEAGYNDFVILERGEEVGGTWRDNDYPGCTCDIPSFLYSFSFEPNPNWTRSYPGWAEILDYLKRTARKYDLYRHIRFKHDVTAMTWNATAGEWHTAAESPKGEVTFNSRYLIIGSGPLSEPTVPSLPGLESFAGHSFHSAEWDHDYDLTGKRVAVVGTGASAIQFIPKIQPLVGKMTVFQRTPPWIIPRLDHRLSGPEQWILRHVPGAHRLLREAIFYTQEARVLGFQRPKVMRQIERLGKFHIRRQVRDPELRERLIPDYVPGCKRILISDDYYPAIQQPNVELVTEGVVEVGAQSVTDAAGREHPVDTIIFGTGFEVTKPRIAERIRGRDGQILSERWAEGMEAFKGTAVPGFPNLFFMLGPNTGTGHNSVIHFIESQVPYVIAAIEETERRGGISIEVTESAENRFNQWLQDALDGSVWTEGNCRSWYLDERGRNTTLWPGSATSFRKELAEFDVDAYVIREREKHEEPTAV